MTKVARKRKALTPRTASTGDQICKLERDNTETKGYWILVDETTVHLHAQRAGEASTASIAIPKRDFDKFVDFYNGIS